MNINNPTLQSLTFFYPLGNTPPVVLTQDLLLEQQAADILLLGCGDARNVLFTCFVDNSRKLDITCCDIKPGIHARNILLYTLLLDDEAGLNVESIWNIYYHWKIDKKSLKLLETQTDKLLQMSKSIDEWHDSIYGSTIRFCDARSLSSVRCHWSCFMLEGLSSSVKEDRLKQFQDTIDRAKTFRESMNSNKSSFKLTGLRSMFPIQDFEAVNKICEVTNQWWTCGMVSSSNELAAKPTELNPTFLYSPNKTLMLHYDLSPLHGFPLSIAQTPITKESPLFFERESISLVKNLIDGVKTQFTQWASAFRRAVANELVIRIFSGDALAFCFTLRNCQLTQSPSMNLFCHMWTYSPLNLHHNDYGHQNNAAPVSFDIIDSSNLVDHLGPLNVIPLASSLLKHHASSSLYSEILVQYDSNVADRLSSFFGVDVRTLSLLLGLVAPELFTNAMNSMDDDVIINAVLESSSVEKTVNPSATQKRSRLHWKRLRGCHISNNSPFIQVEPKSLAKFLIQVHDAMFQHENPSLLLKCLELNGLPGVQRDVAKQCNPHYNRTSFAFILSVIKANIASDWDECMKTVFTGIFSDSYTCSSMNCKFALDLALSLRYFSVYNDKFPIPASTDLNDAILAPILPARQDLPDQLCVTVRVSREHLKIFSVTKCGTPAVICSFEGRDPVQWSNNFSSLQLVLGKLREKTEVDGPYPFIEEDCAQPLGTSDMFVSVIVPTAMLLQSKLFVPLVKCRLVSTVQNTLLFTEKLGRDLCFTCKEMTSKDVFITKFMPGLSALPTFHSAHKKIHNPTSEVTTAQFQDDGAKVKFLVKRVTLESETARTTLASKSSTVSVDFKSPLAAVLSIGGSLKLKLEFPIPVSVLNSKIRVARKSSYVEVVTRLFNPLEEDAAFFIFPTFLTNMPCGTTVPIPWTSMRVNLDVMPELDLRRLEALSWLPLHASQMFSPREVQIRNAQLGNDIRTEIKEGLFCLFMQYTGIQGEKFDIFGLSSKIGQPDILIFPSCLRLDLANYTVVLDCAIIPLTQAMRSDRKAYQFFQEFFIDTVNISQIKSSESENRAWKSMMPALVERCRTWQHTSDCEYILDGEVPLPKGLSIDKESPLCSCGVGKFPEGFLKEQLNRFSTFSYMLKYYATRAAISPIFAVQYVEDFSTDNFKKNLNTFISSMQNPEKCGKCGRGTRKDGEDGEDSPQGLFTCSRCKVVKYCSTDCQKADWKNHKSFCSTAGNVQMS